MYPLNIVVIDTEVIVTGCHVAARSGVRCALCVVLHVISDGRETPSGDIGVGPYGSVVATVLDVLSRTVGRAYVTGSLGRRIAGRRSSGSGTTDLSTGGLVSRAAGVTGS